MLGAGREVRTQVNSTQQISDLQRYPPPAHVSRGFVAYPSFLSRGRLHTRPRPRVTTTLLPTLRYLSKQAHARFEDPRRT